MNDCKYLKDELGYCKNRKDFRWSPKWFCYHVCSNYKPKKINMVKAFMGIMPLVIGLAVQRQLQESFEKTKVKRKVKK